MAWQRAAIVALLMASWVGCMAADDASVDVHQDVSIPGNRSILFGPAPFKAAGLRHAYELITKKPYIISVNNLGQDTAKLVEKNELPWQVALMRRDGNDVTLFCGGAHIGGGWILTAAHCVVDNSQAQNVKAADIRIATGVVSLIGIKLGQTSPVIQGPYPAQTYDTLTWKDDVALVRIADKTLPIAPLPTATQEQQLTTYGSILDISGWGASVPHQNTFSVLRKTSVAVSSLAACASQYPDKSVTSIQVCAGNKTATFCDGDSGGPLFSESLPGPAQFLGVMSFNDDECTQDVSLPGVYTLVSQEMAFITKYTGFTLASMALAAAAQQH
jgi:lysyl endopeptidase